VAAAAFRTRDPVTRGQKVLQVVVVVVGVVVIFLALYALMAMEVSD
jgi:energy-converting hydrogenase Eha subunit E